MVGIYDSGPYEDPFAWAGSDLDLALLAQQQQQQQQQHQQDQHLDQFARSTPQDLTFPAAGPVHHPQRHHDFPMPISPIGAMPKSAVSLPPDQAYLSLSHSLQDFENATMTDAGAGQTYLPPGHTGNMDLDLDLEALGIPAFPTTTTITTTTAGNRDPSMTAESLSTQLETARNLITTLQASLTKITRERDQAKMQLATARNELYTARQVEKRLRVDRDEAHAERKQIKAQVETLKRERAMGKMNESRLRRERNEARMALVFKGIGVPPSAGARGIRVTGGQTGLGAVGLGPGERDMESMDEGLGGLFGGTSTEESSPAGEGDAVVVNPGPGKAEDAKKGS
ncbi:hypothetical protein QBC40DRAFT_176114 [Triangularia verruculosa]|uniref:Uncharacterized protein n=1 Tax=Triangularia verruculosa TaxID=2587418 RepID=A0AAN6XF91_9PEZI|nr:hypothetical protein QBC40DRAFT_176114 [Triangularia verruculosa]